MEQKVAEKRQRISTLGQIGLQQFAPYLMNRIMTRSRRCSTISTMLNMRHSSQRF